MPIIRDYQNPTGFQRELLCSYGSEFEGYEFGISIREE